MTDEQKEKIDWLRMAAIAHEQSEVAACRALGVDYHDLLGASACRAGADAIEKLAKVEAALQTVLEGGAMVYTAIKGGFYCAFERDREGNWINWGDTKPTAIDALLAAHEAAKEGK